MFIAVIGPDELIGCKQNCIFKRSIEFGGSGTNAVPLAWQDAVVYVRTAENRLVVND
jgi:hypothetical protein